MKPTRSHFPAAVSLLAVLALGVALVGATQAFGATRPRYGGTLRVELQALVSSVPSAGEPRDLAEGEAQEKLVALVADRLVRVDDRGRIQPMLALSWQHNADSSRWEFYLRPGVKFHDGTALTPRDVAASLNASSGGAWAAVPANDHVVLSVGASAPDLLFTLALGRFAIFKRNGEGAVVATGPFSIAEWQATPAGNAKGRGRAVLAANEDYWDGRPYLDKIEIHMGRPLREQLVDFELGRVDLVEIAPDQVRRETQSGRHVWSSAPLDLLALRMSSADRAVEDVRLRQALALALDRPAIFSVLLQRQGEMAGGLLPQWLSGYAFLFSTAPDVERARKLVAELPRAPGPLVLAFNEADALARVIAERIVVDARAAGLTLRAVASANAEDTKDANVRLVRQRVLARPGGRAEGIFAASNIPEYPFPSATAIPAEQLFEAESKELRASEMIPLFHLPEIYGLGQRVRNWSAPRWGGWRLEDVWLAPEEAVTPPPGAAKP